MSRVTDNTPLSVTLSVNVIVTSIASPEEYPPFEEVVVMDKISGLLRSLKIEATEGLDTFPAISIT